MVRARGFRSGHLGRRRKPLMELRAVLVAFGGEATLTYLHPKVVDPNGRSGINCSCTRSLHRSGTAIPVDPAETMRRRTPECVMVCGLAQGETDRATDRQNPTRHGEACRVIGGGAGPVGSHSMGAPGGSPPASPTPLKVALIRRTFVHRCYRSRGSRTNQTHDYRSDSEAHYGCIDCGSAGNEGASSCPSRG